MYLRAGIDQERAHGRWRRTFEIRVVEHRAVLVECDDVAVGQLCIDMTDRGAVVAVNIELRFAGTERGLGGDMAFGAPSRSETHDGELVFRFRAA